MKGQMIDFKANGESYQGYLSQTTGGAPGVVVIQEWWGLVDHIKELCDRFSASGFSALAPDLYKGQKTTTPDEAGKLLMALNIAESEKILRSAVFTLLSHPCCNSKTVGVVGFCMGGQLSLYAACSNPEKVSACVDFYGIHPNVDPPFEQLKAPVLGFFAEKDQFVNEEAVEALRERLQKTGKQHEFHIYPGVDHAFFNDTRPGIYNAEAATDSWNRTLEFFRKHIK